jgi:hypothetical protein
MAARFSAAVTLQTYVPAPSTRQREIGGRRLW